MVKKNKDQSSAANLTYRHKMSGHDVARYIKAVGLPIGIFLLSMFVISRFAAFGASIIAPLTGLMWGVGLLAALGIPSQRRSLLNEVCIATAVYLIGIALIRELIALLAGVSSEMLMASFGQAIPTTGGNTIEGYLQIMLWVTTVATPLGLSIKWGKQFFTFRMRPNKSKIFNQIRSIRDDGHSHTSS